MVQKTVGVIGGLGPAATVEFMSSLLARSSAETERDHLHILVDSNPKVPDINAAALGEGPSAAPALQAMAQRLETAGADFLVMVCNAGHHFEGEIIESVSIPFLSMIGETCRSISAQFSASSKIGILATDGCLKTKVYQNALLAQGLEPAMLSAEQMVLVMDAIGRIKSGSLGQREKTDLLRVIDSLAAQGAQCVIMACTEISLVVTQSDTPVPLIDPSLVLAERTVEFANTDVS